jgi:hypothetical protein
MPAQAASPALGWCPTASEPAHKNVGAKVMRDCVFTDTGLGSCTGQVPKLNHQGSGMVPAIGAAAAGAHDKSHSDISIPAALLRPAQTASK